MVTIRKNYRAILRQELARRQKLNRRYSLRAFARFLDLSPSRLSAILRREDGLSAEKARALGLRLGFGPQQLQYFCDLVESEHARSAAEREAARLRVRKIRGVSLWPKDPPLLTLQRNLELDLWGVADPEAVGRHLSRAGNSLVPYRDPELGGACRVGLMVRKNLDDSAPSYEYSGIILVADFFSTKGFGLLPFDHRTDSVSVVRTRESLFGVAPRLTGRILLDVEGPDFSARVDDEGGRPLLSLEAARLGRIRRESSERFSVIRNVSLDGGPARGVRVVGRSVNRDKKFDPETDSFHVRAESETGRLLRDFHFRPVSWRYYRSRYDYFP